MEGLGRTETRCNLDKIGMEATYLRTLDECSRINNDDSMFWGRFDNNSLVNAFPLRMKTKQLTQTCHR